jgi:DNA-binding transcriptional LysR family regulator
MENLRGLLPSASRLILFEAAARHLNFSRAAKELCVSQAAVSQAVRALEDDLGVQLFLRVHRAVELTDPGERLFIDVSTGMGRIQKTVEDIRQKSRDASVTIAASSAFASMWMLPRLERFREDLPNIDLRIQTSVRDLDLINEPVPLAVRGGRPEDWPQYHAAPIASEVITAVASPAFIERNGIDDRMETLARQRLIWLDEPVRTALDWPQWFAAGGFTLPRQARKLVINDYVLVIQAVLAGQGVALGWRHLIEPQIAAGLLQPVTSHVVHTGAAFYVVWPRTRELNQRARAVRDWLIADGERREPDRHASPI